MCIEGALTKSLYIQFADKAVNSYALLVKLYAAGNVDARYMRIWQDVMSAVSSYPPIHDQMCEKTKPNSDLYSTMNSKVFSTE